MPMKEDERMFWFRDNWKKDLYGVGPLKPVGYLPVFGLIMDAYVNPASLMKNLKKDRPDLCVIPLNQEESNILCGAIYAYHEPSLSKLLNKNKVILQDAGWPTEPELFVRHLKFRAPSGTSLFSVIADAFGDYGNPDKKLKEDVPEPHSSLAKKWKKMFFRIFSFLV